MRRWRGGEAEGGSPPASRGPLPVEGRWIPIMGLAVGALAVGLVVTTFVPAPHNGGDNAGYIALARSLLDGGYVESWDPAAPPHTKYPPVFPAVLAVLVAAGAETWSALKAVPAFFTVLSVLLVYTWAARRRGPFFGAGVAALTALSGAFLWSSHWILSDPPFVAFTFLALWALDRADGTDALLHRWLAVGFAAALLAYFTRSAGLPLLVVVAAWLGLRHRWRLLALFTLLAGVPAVAWWLRARGAPGDADYVSEFWMVDPYRPELGRVGGGGLLERAVSNLQGYVGTWIPEGLVGGGGIWVSLLGLVLAALAVTGWARRMDRRPAAAELFFPVYGGLILFWPEVWSGDRFALPLFPLLLFYAAEAVEWGAVRWVPGAERGRGGAVRWAMGAAFAVVAVPAAVGWTGAVREATACGNVFRTGGTWACYGPAWTTFGETARWAGANLPAGAAVLTRKPRLFYVMGGVPSRTFPFTTDPEAFLAEAEAAGTRYVVLDYLDGQATRYVGAVIQRLPAAFCAVRAFPSAPGAGLPATQLLGLVAPDSGLGGSLERRGGQLAAALPPCPDGYRTTSEQTPPPLDPTVVPLLAEGN